MQERGKETGYTGDGEERERKAFASDIGSILPLSLLITGKEDSPLL